MALELAINDFTLQYGRTSAKVLRELNLAVPAGSVCAILGPTNSGKTSLLHAIAGILGAHHHGATGHGTIRIDSETYSPFPRTVLFPKVGLTLQEPYFQISGLRDTVLGEVSLTLEANGAPNHEVRQKAPAMLAMLGLQHLADRQPSSLSGGEMQRVALATILVAQPPILLLDEPANSLDSTAQHQLAGFIHTLKDQSTVVMADYRIDFALQVADWIAVLHDGTIVFTGSRRQFIDSLSRFQSILPIQGLMESLDVIGPGKLRERILKAVGV